MAVDPNKQRVAIRYRADDGQFYSVVTSRNHAAAVGATGALPTDPPLPTKWRPRKVNLLQVQAGRDRTLQVVCPDDQLPIWTGAADTLLVNPYGPLEITGRSGEGRTQGAPGFDGNANPPNERVSIRYRSENGQDYSIVTTRAHAAAVQAEDGSAYRAFPDVWTPRHYILTSPNLTGRDQKMILVEGNPNAPAYLSNQAYEFNVGGVIFNTTGRKEEDRPRGAPPY